MTKKEAVIYFKANYMPRIWEAEKKANCFDYPMRREAWNNFVDGAPLSRKQKYSWNYPDICCNPIAICCKKK